MLLIGFLYEKQMLNMDGIDTNGYMTKYFFFLLVNATVVKAVYRFQNFYWFIIIFFLYIFFLVARYRRPDFPTIFFHGNMYFDGLAWGQVKSRVLESHLSSNPPDSNEQDRFRATDDLISAKALRNFHSQLLTQAKFGSSSPDIHCLPPLILSYQPAS